jgi:hypothetical protein
MCHCSWALNRQKCSRTTSTVQGRNISISSQGDGLHMPLIMLPLQHSNLTAGPTALLQLLATIARLPQWLPSRRRTALTTCLRYNSLTTTPPRPSTNSSAVNTNSTGKCMVAIPLLTEVSEHHLSNVIGSMVPTSSRSRCLDQYTFCCLNEPYHVR